MGSVKHKHHIVPRHAGGSDDPSNLVEVSVEEHAQLHFALYLEHGKVADWIAYHCLSGKTSARSCTATTGRGMGIIGWLAG